MLVLTRKRGEGVFVGKDIKVTLVRGGRGQARLAIEAPLDVKIEREELRSARLGCSRGPSVKGDQTVDG